MSEGSNNPERFAQSLREKQSRGDENSLLMQALSDINILELKLTNAENDRREMKAKLDELLKAAHVAALQEQTLTGTLSRLEHLEESGRKNTEFRLKFEGGGMIIKMFWLVGGGFAFWILQQFWEKRG